MRQPLVTAFAAGVLIAASPAYAPSGFAGDQPDRFSLQTTPNPDADALLCATIQRLVEALGQVLQDVPRYAAPEMDRDGNIILRRLNPPSPMPRPLPPGSDLDQAAT